MQAVLDGPADLAQSIYDGATEDLNEAPVFPITLEDQAQTSKVTYALDTFCSGVGFLDPIAENIYEWVVKVRKGTAPTSTALDPNGLQALAASSPLPEVAAAGSLSTEIAGEFVTLAKEPGRVSRVGGA